MENERATIDHRKILEAKLLPLLGLVLKDSVADAAAFRFDKHRPEQLTSVCTYCTIIELAHGEVALLEHGQTAGLSVVLRSIFEAFADLNAVLDDANYVRRMYATFISEKVRFLKNVLKHPSNPFFVGIVGGMDAKGELASLERERAKLEKAGGQPLSNESRFESGKLRDEYQSIYWLLCLEGHNNMSALDDRHIEKHGDDFEVTLFKAPDPVALVSRIDALLAVLIESGRRVHEFLKTGAADHYRRHREALERLREEYLRQ